MKPEVGMGLTVGIGSDRHAYTIVSVSPTGKSFTATQDRAIRTDDNGMSDLQTYRFEPIPNGELVRFSSRLGVWQCVYGKRITLGVRSAFYDFTF